VGRWLERVESIGLALLPIISSPQDGSVFHELVGNSLLSSKAMLAIGGALFCLNTCMDGSVVNTS